MLDATTNVGTVVVGTCFAFVVFFEIQIQHADQSNSYKESNIISTDYVTMTLHVVLRLTPCISSSFSICDFILTMYAPTVKTLHSHQAVNKPICTNLVPSILQQSTICRSEFVGETLSELAAHIGMITYPGRQFCPFPEL